MPAMGLDQELRLSARRSEQKPGEGASMSRAEAIAILISLSFLSAVLLVSISLFLQSPWR